MYTVNDLMSEIPNCNPCMETRSPLDRFKILIHATHTRREGVVYLSVCVCVLESPSSKK